jgi:hypothetical protein
MHRTWNLEGGGFAGKLKSDTMEGLELEGMGREGAQLGSSEGGKIAEAEVEGSNADSLELDGASLESLRVVKFPRSHAEGVDLEGGGFTRGSSRVAEHGMDG